MPAPPIQQVFDDPDFWDNSKLDDSNRHKVLSTIDPDYARLPTVDRNTVLGTMRKRYEAKVSPTLTNAPKVPLPAGLAAMSPREAREQSVAPAFRQPTNAELEESMHKTDAGALYGNLPLAAPGTVAPSTIGKLKSGASLLGRKRLFERALTRTPQTKKELADLGEGVMETAAAAGPFSAPAKAVAATTGRTIGAAAGLGAGVGAGMAVPKLNEAAAQRIGMRIQKPLDPDEERLASLGIGIVGGGLAHEVAPRMMEAVRTAPLQTLPKISSELTPTKLAPITPDTPQSQLSVIPPERRLAAPAVQMPAPEPSPGPVARQAKQVGTKITMQDEMAQPGTQMEMPFVEPNEVRGPQEPGQQGTLWTSGEIPQTKVTTTPIFSSESGAPVAPSAQPELPPAPPAKPKSPITNPPPTLERQIRQLDQQLADPNLQPPQRRKLLEQRQQLAKQSVELAGFTPVRNLEAIVSPSRPEATTLAKRYLELEAQLSPDSPDVARITPQARQLAEAAMSDIRTALGPEAIEQVRQGKNIGKWQEAGLREGMRTMADVRAGKAAAKESAIASGAAPPSGPPSAAQTLEDLFTPTEKPGIIESTIKSVDALYHKYIFRGRLPKAPWANRVVNDLRKVKDALVDAGQFSNNKLKEVAEPIYNSTTDKAERAAKVDQLERIVNLQAWIDGYKRKSQTLPAADQIPLEAFENALADLKSTAPPEVLESVRRHDALGKELGQMLADRGKMPQEIVDDPYFPRFYEEWTSNKQTEDLYRKKMKSMKLDVPERLYTKEKLGSELKPETNYFDVMDRHIKQIMLDNAMDDTVAKIVNENDQWTKLSKADRTYLHQQWGGAEPTPGTTYRLSDGTHLKAWASKVPPELATGTPLGDAVVQSLGTDSRRISLLKPELADHLDQFRTPRVPNSVLAYINKATSQWKRGVLGYSGLKFIIKQIPDNYLVAYREHDLIQTIAKSKEAWDILTGKYDGDTPLTMTEDRLRKIRLLREQRVFSGPSSVFSGELSGHHANLPTELSELRGENQFFRKVAYMANIMESIGDQHARVAKFLADLERIDRGERPQTTTVDVSGLDPIDAAGKISREAFIDNGAKSDMFQQQISGFAMPFVWWAAKSIPQWGRYFTNPENYRTIDNPALRFGVPFALMQVWNNTVTKDVEKLHSDWYRTLPHLNTTYTTKDGYPVSVSLDTGAGVLMRFIGADRAGMLLSKIHSGEISPDDALSELATAAPRGMGGIAWAQLNPMLKLTFDLVAGRNLETGRKIVSDQDSADLQNEKRLKYAVGSAIAPAGKLLREANKPSDIAWGQDKLSAAVRPYVGGAGAAAVAPFDIYSAFAHEQDPNQAARSKYFNVLHTTMDRAREQDEKVAGPYLDALATAYANHFDPAHDIPGIGNVQLANALAKANSKLREEVARQNRIIEAANAQNPSTQKLPLVTSDQIKRYATSPAAMRQVVKRAIVMASSPERKKALQTFADALVHKADVEQFKGLSPGIQKVVPVPPAPIVRVP